MLFNSPSTSAPALERKIEKQLRASLGYDVATFVRTPAEVQQVAAYEPFSAAVTAAPYHAIYISFLRDAAVGGGAACSGGASQSDRRLPHPGPRAVSG